ncbi:MAG: hypothetical protein COA46_07080 [Porticoccaceae bacterium]|nr:MAG: hypothetical protein COA46_07080 [Porticoccaceae bacterium]
MSYVSRALYHFNGFGKPNNHEKNYEVLKEILRQGCISSPPHLPKWGEIRFTYYPDRSLLGELEGRGMINPSMVCFADIPAKYLDIHCQKYGYFGLALKRSYLTRHGARPVFYIPVDDLWSIDNWGHRCLKNLEAAYRTVVSWKDEYHEGSRSKKITIEHEPKTIEGKLALLSYSLSRDTLCFVKPFKSTLPDDHLDNFYMEREWRMLMNAYFSEDTDAVEKVCVPGDYINDLKDEFPIYASRIVDTFKMINSSES